MSNDIKKAIDDIDIPEGAEERMYANILKKASAEKKKPNIKLYTSICAAAACAAIVIVSAAIMKNNSDADIAVDETSVTTSASTSSVTAEQEDMVEAGNPFANEYTFDDILAAGFEINLPENAEVTVCNLYDGDAVVRFSIDGHLYYYSISKDDGDFSGVYGKIVESENISDNIVLDITSENYLKAHWNGNQYNYFLCNTDGAERDAISQTALFLADQIQ
mgnify:FL=1